MRRSTATWVDKPPAGCHRQTPSLYLLASDLFEWRAIDPTPVVRVSCV